jgi:hypothetical protein
MTRQGTRRDRAICCKAFDIELPRLQDVVDVVVQTEEAVLHRA